MIKSQFLIAPMTQKILAVICNSVIMSLYHSRTKLVRKSYEIPISYSTHKTKKSAVICNFVIVSSHHLPTTHKNKPELQNVAILNHIFLTTYP
jgi:hypothetical protein